MHRGDTQSHGFTIIEVMVAILLLATALVAVFGAQFGAISSTSYARDLTQAVELARCRMSEIELLLAEEGFQEGDVAESGECCQFLDDVPDINDTFVCHTVVKTILFPTGVDLMGDDDDDDDFSLLGGLGLGEDATSTLGIDSALEAFLPMVTDLLEQAIRRVTVSVQWQQGTREREFELVQYVTNPTQGVLELLQQAGATQGLVEDAVEATSGTARGADAGTRRGSSTESQRGSTGTQRGSTGTQRGSTGTQRGSTGRQR
ncbi:MAG: prepilin-type N-terminal cleavage/methylation domain-containing protein [Proteobacteria bacterium]|nr:prepilin-type N-terminal cleavage/methylation domain-containing protein [Pseudomonadota bacterium]